MSVIHPSETAKHVVDGLSIATVLGTLTELLPAASALLTAIWMGIRIYETQTIRKLLGKDIDDAE